MSRRRVVLAGSVAAALTGCGGAADQPPTADTPSAPQSSSHPPATFNLTGDLTLSSFTNFGRVTEEEGAQCTGRKGFDDVVEGAQVTVSDDTGRLLATSSLDQGRYQAEQMCVFTFTVSSVPDSPFYKVEVSHRGAVAFDRDRARAGDVHLTLGS